MIGVGFFERKRIRLEFKILGFKSDADMYSVSVNRDSKKYSYPRDIPCSLMGLYDAKDPTLSR
jgi:hypothetical protein